MDEARETISFTLDGKPVEALVGESIWQVASRHQEHIPHLCYSPEPDYEANGNCRACMVEIAGERTLVASCMRKPTAGMKVKSASSERAQQSRKLVLELLLSDHPVRNQAHDKNAKIWHWAEQMSARPGRFPAKAKIKPDTSHAAIAVHMDSCISCQLCLQACRDVQVNDVIGLAKRGARTEIVFDFADPMGQSTCVSCGECVQACPTGALTPAKTLDSSGVGIFEPEQKPDRQVSSVCPYCGVGCQLTYNIKDDKILYVEGANGPALFAIARQQRRLRPDLLEILADREALCQHRS